MGPWTLGEGSELYLGVVSIQAEEEGLGSDEIAHREQAESTRG